MDFNDFTKINKKIVIDDNQNFSKIRLIIIKAWWQHRFFWFSLSNHPYWCPVDGIQYLDS